MAATPLTDAKKHQPSLYPLPITKSTFDRIVASLRTAITEEHQRQRMEYMVHKLHRSKVALENRSAEQREYDDGVVRSKKPALVDEDPFASEWLPRESTLPRFPPHEVTAARQRSAAEVAAVAAAQGEQDPSSYPALVPFVEAHETLLCMTVDELNTISYLDSFIFKFALTRKFDMKSATERFLNFRAYIQQNPVSFVLTDEIRAGMQFGSMHYLPSILANAIDGMPIDTQRPSPTGGSTEPTSTTEPDDAGRFGNVQQSAASEPPFHPRTVVGVGHAKAIDWKKTSPEQMQQAGFYHTLLGASLDYHVQVVGFAFILLCDGMSMANVNTKADEKAGAAMSKCLPLKIQRTFVVNEPWFIGKILWPIVRLFLSQKVRNMTWLVGKDYAKVITALSPQRVPRRIGGEVTNVDIEDAPNQIRAIELLAEANGTRTQPNPK